MTRPSRKGYSDPEAKDGTVAGSTGENGAGLNAAYEGPTELVELDIVDPHFMAEAYDTYADLRSKGPVSRVRFAGGGEEKASGDGAKEEPPSQWVYDGPRKPKTYPGKGHLWMDNLSTSSTEWLPEEKV